MSDIERSLARAAIRQGWTFDDRWSRMGSPFTWVDGQRMAPETFLTDVYAVLQYVSMFYERYDTLDELRTDDHDAVRDDLAGVVRGLVAHLFPHLVDDARVASNIECTALTRTQDYGAIRTFCTDLVEAPAHLDIGPGLGSHALYSLRHLGGRYLGLEASPHSYSIQRHVFRFLVEGGPGYLDPIVMEELGASDADVAAAIADTARPITHVPSWLADAVPDDSIDLVTATFVLNEVSPAAIVWLLHHISRTVRVGGYVYLRDSGRRKPNRHDLDYDAMLVELGFEECGRLDVENRVDMFGIPRAYRRRESVATDGFDAFFDRCFGRVASTSHEGGYMQNLPSMLTTPDA